MIDWSWNLLDAAEQRALRRLALFDDGFTLEAADAVLGAGALDTVQGLVDQSLLSVREADGVRFRMLETAREFGRLKLAAAGEEAEARAAQRRWALAYVRRHGDRLAGPGQWKRSKTPLSMSSRSCTPVAMQVVRTVWATMPGIISGR